MRATCAFASCPRSPLSCNSDTPTQFYNGSPAEQRPTLAPLTLPAGPYLSRLVALPAKLSEQSVALSLQTPPPAALSLRWNWSFAPLRREPYLTQQSILDSFLKLRPALRVR